LFFWLLRSKCVFQFFEGKAKLGFSSFFVFGRRRNYVFLGFLNFSDLGLHRFHLKILEMHFHNLLVIHNISTITPVLRQSCRSMRPPLLYICDQTARRMFGINHIKTPRPSTPRAGQETSADGTGPDKTCARQGGAISCTACGSDASDRAYCPKSHNASSLPDRDRAPARTAGRKGRYRSTAFSHIGGLV
jgi:hypothetical protein